MNYKIVLAFVAGVGVGVVATKQYWKKRYSDIEDENVAAFKREWARSEPKSEKTDEERPEVKEQDVVDYAEAVSRLNYSGASEAENISAAVTAHKRANEPYIIPPEEFGELEDHEQITFWHCSDGVLIDENDERVEDVEGAVGGDYAEHFGEYDEGAVHIRNDRLKVDYEILLEMRSYAEILKSKPYLRED